MRTYLRFLKRNAWLLLLTPAAAVAATALVLSGQPSVYRATMKMVVAQQGGTTQAEIGSQKLSQTMSNLLESDVVAREVIKRQSLDTTPDELLKDLHVSFQPDSSVLAVSFDSTSRAAARSILREFSSVFQALSARTLRVRWGRSALGRSETPVITGDVFDPPHLERNRISPKPARTLALAIALGFAAGLLIAFARESLDANLRDRRDAERWFGAPVLGALPRGACGKPPPEMGQEPSNGRLIEARRVLSANLLFSDARVEGSTLLITSAQNAEGKTTVAANLAAELAASGKNVICVDADMRHSRLHVYLGLEPGGDGLADVLEGRVALDKALEEVTLSAPSLDHGRFFGGSTETNGSRLQAPQGRLQALKAGRPPGNPAGLLTPEAVSSVMEELKSKADYVIVDSPPLLALADAFPLALQADKVLVVARVRRTAKDRAEAVRSTLHGLGVSSIAVVLTDAPPRDGFGYSGH